MTRRLPPTEEEVLLIASLIEANVHLDRDLRMAYHSSMKGYTAVRIIGATWGRDWFVDAYRGPWFVINVPGFETTTADNHFSLVTILGALLKGK